MIVYDVGLRGLEPLTSSLSGKRSNRLSYRPVIQGSGSATSPVEITPAAVPHPNRGGAEAGTSVFARVVDVCAGHNPRKRR